MIYLTSPIPLDFFSITILSSLGVGIALIASMAGLGGGLIFIPVLMLFYQLPIEQAVPISLLAMTGTTISCSIPYAIHHRINYKLAILYDVLDPAGIIVGAVLLTILIQQVVIAIVATLIFVIGTALLRKVRSERNAHRMEAGAKCENTAVNPDPNSQVNANKVKINHQNTAAALASSFGSGFVSGFAGLGGGITDTTTMILTGVPPHIACPTSEFAMAITNMIAVLTHALIGNMVWEIAIPLMIGAIIGAQLGAHYSAKVKSHVLIYIIIAFAWVTTARLVISAFIGF